METNTSKRLSTKLGRTLYNSPLSTRRGQLVLFVIVAALVVFLSPAIKAYYTTYPLQMFAGVLFASLLYLPSLIVIWFLDRRDRKPIALVLFTILSVAMFFDLLAGHTYAVLDAKLHIALLLVGFIEEFWKMAPLLLTVFFIPRAIKGVRDGFIFGALAGFGFAIGEYALNNTFDFFSQYGWGFLLQGIGRANFLGTSNHILWSSVVGAAIGWAVTTKNKKKAIAIPILVYLAIALLHTLNDKGGNIVSTMIGGAIIEPLVSLLSNPEQFVNSNLTLMQLVFGTVNVLVINLVLWPILYLILKKSGEAQRNIIRVQLENENPDVITKTEFEGVENDRRLKTRKIETSPLAIGRSIVQLQNELALMKEFVMQKAGDINQDPTFAALRELIRSKRTSQGRNQ